MGSQFLGIITILVVVFSIGSPRAEANDDAFGSDADELFTLLREGDKSIKFDPNYKDLIILIGNPGAGKTTIGLILTANQSLLEAYEDEDSSINLIRDNGGRISSDVAKSKTIFPELMINPENGAAFYDCPGFRDTRQRNASIDVANTIFIKKIADHARTIKVVMIVNYYSVLKNGGREDFLNLLRSTLKLLKPVEKFVNSTALITTKAFNVKDPMKTVQTVANYLNSFKKSLPDVLHTLEDVRRGEILLNALSLEVNGRYPRIYFTRTPSEVGLLSNIPEMQEDRLNIGKVIYENLKYAPVSADDFGYTFSTEAEKLLSQMVNKLELNAEKQVGILCSGHQWYFEKLVSQDPDIKKFIAPVSDAKSRMKEFLKEAVKHPNVSASRFVDDLMNSFPNGTVDMGPKTSEIFSAIESDKKVLSLLRHVTDTTMKSHLVLTRVQRLVNALQILQDWLLLLGEIDVKLNNLSQLTTESERNNETYAVSTNQYVNESSWFVVLQRLSSHCNQRIPFAKDQISEVVKDSTAIFHFNQIIGRVIETRWASVGLTLRKLSSGLKYHFISDESSLSRQMLQQIERIFAEEIDNCASNGLIAPVQFINALEGSITATTFYGPLPAVISALEVLQDDQEVLRLFKDVDESMTQRNACAVYQDIEEFKNFSTSTLHWFDHVDQIASNVPLNISAHKPNNTLFVNPENSISLFSNLSNQFQMKQPTNPEIPKNVKPIQLHLNQMLIDLCTLVSKKISEAMNSVTKAVVNNLRSKISKLESADDLVVEVLRLKLNFTTHRENAVTCQGKRSLEKFLNEQYKAQMNSQSECELMEVVRSNIPRFCKQDSMATLSPLLAIDSLFEYTLAWYEFLFVVANHTDSYRVQCDKSMYNVANLAHWGQEGMPQGIHVTLQNCKQFVKRASRTIGTTHGRRAELMCKAVSQLTASSNETTPLDHLDGVLTLAFKTIRTCTFTDGVATAKGPYVKLSEALQCIQPGATQRLVILASHGFFIDVNLNAVELNRGKTFDLIVISPDWTSAATTISLDGPNASEWTSTTTLGQPGNPGGNGGNFFGLAQNLSGLSFTISTNGGNAGAGQKGEPGRIGYNGDFCNKACILSLIHNGNCDEDSYGGVSLTSLYGYRVIEDRNSVIQYALKGTPAGSGGRGGDGGKGGIGGNPGYNLLQVFCNNGSRLYQQRSNEGVNGQDGAGGAGGLGGLQNEVRLVVDVHRQRYEDDDRWFFDLFGSISVYYRCWISQTLAGSEESRASSGENGVRGRNAIGLQRPPVNDFNATEILLKFSAAFTTEASRHLDLFKKKQLNAFQKQLESFQIANSNINGTFC